MTTGQRGGGDAPADAVTGAAVLGGVPCWHALDVGATLARLGTSPAGLSDGERARRLAACGPNLPEGRHRRERWWAELGESLAEPLQLLLIAVAVLSAVFGEVRDAIAIAAVIAAVAVTETITEVRASAAIEALRAMTAPVARLHRDTGPAEVLAASLVPGDMLAVEAGDIVPADARVLAARGLWVDESTLAGEAEPAGKSDTASSRGHRPATAADAAATATSASASPGPAGSSGTGSALTAAATQVNTSCTRPARTCYPAVRPALPRRCPALPPLATIMGGSAWPPLPGSGVRAGQAGLAAASSRGARGRGGDTGWEMMPDPISPRARIVRPTTASAQIVKRCPGAKNTPASLSRSAMVTTAWASVRAGRSLSSEITAGKYVQRRGSTRQPSRIRSKPHRAASAPAAGSSLTRALKLCRLITAVSRITAWR